MQSSVVLAPGSTSGSTLAIDPTALRTPIGDVFGAAGHTWNHQVWRRGSLGGSLFTNAVSLYFY